MNASISRLLLVLAAWLLLCAAPARAQSQVGGYHNALAGAVNLNEQGLALDGYDPVAYHVDGRAVRGREDLAVIYRGAPYLFSSEEHVRLFEADPERYEPAYGGWCAYGLALEPGAHGNRKPGKYRVDPRSFKIIDGRLHLFQNSGGFDARALWNRDETHHLERADATWTRLQAFGQ